MVEKNNFKFEGAKINILQSVHDMIMNRHSQQLARLFSYLFLSCLLLAGCSLEYFARDNGSGFAESRCGKYADDQTAAIYVTNLGWHTGIVLRTEDVRSELSSLLEEVDHFKWIEVGWGDRKFYMSSGFSLWDGIEAVFFSSNTVLHVSAFNEPPESNFSNAELIKLSVSEEVVHKVAAKIKNTLEINSQGGSTRLGAGLYGNGGFYAAAGTFSLRNTCNTWTATVLNSAGCQVRPKVSRASRVMHDLKLGP